MDNLNIEYISLWDLILIPLYLLLSYIFLVLLRKKNTGNSLMQRYLVKAFFYRAAFAILLCLLIYFYYGFGDTMTYFREAMNVKAAIKRGDVSLTILFRDYDYVTTNYDGLITGANSGWIIERIALVLSYLTFNSYLTITLLCALITYSGVFKMFEAFAGLMPQWHSKISLLVLYFPSVTIYGSGLLKDSFCIAALGWLIYCVYQIFMKRNFKLKYMVVAAACIIFIALVKIYIIAAFLIPLLFFIFINFLKNIKNRLVRIGILPFLLAGMLLLGVSLSQELQILLGQYSTDKIAETISQQQNGYQQLDGGSGSFFEIGPMDPSLGGIVKKIPIGIATTLYRPFLWESQNLLVLVSALESFMIMAFTILVIFKAGVAASLRAVLTNAFVFLCIFFSFLFAAFVGISTLNFGTLTRYRIPILPFYMVGLLYILYLQQTKKAGQKPL